MSHVLVNPEAQVIIEEISQTKIRHVQEIKLLEEKLGALQKSCKHSNKEIREFAPNGREVTDVPYSESTGMGVYKIHEFCPDCGYTNSYDEY